MITVNKLSDMQLMCFSLPGWNLRLRLLVPLPLRRMRVLSPSRITTPTLVMAQVDQNQSLSETSRYAPRVNLLVCMPHLCYMVLNCNLALNGKVVACSKEKFLSQFICMWSSLLLMGITCTCPHFNPLPMFGQGFSLSLHLWSYSVSFLALKWVNKVLRCLCLPYTWKKFLYPLA